jgi:hypothetical protein
VLKVSRGGGGLASGVHAEAVCNDVSPEGRRDRATTRAASLAGKPVPPRSKHMPRRSRPSQAGQAEEAAHSAPKKTPHGPWGVTCRRSLLGSHEASLAPFKSQLSAPPLRKARPKVRSATTPCLSRPQLTTRSSPRHPVREVTDHDEFSVDVDDVPACAPPGCSVPVWVDPDGVRFVFCCKTHCRLGREAAEAKRRRVLKSLEASSRPSSSSCSGRRLRALQPSASFLTSL